MIKILLCIALFIALIFAVVIAVAEFFFSSEDHTQFDQPSASQITPMATVESAAHRALVVRLKAEMASPPKGNWRTRLEFMRKRLDEAGRKADIESKVIPVDVDGVPGEWVLAPNASPSHRLLYIHGGAYMTGSAMSHRTITSGISASSGASVLAINYRLMPEHKRLEGLEDVKTAYRWILHHGPDIDAPAKTVFVAGDSSGGNMALSLLAWARDNGVRAADAAVVFSPQTDITLSSPSLQANIATDVMQGESFGPVVKAPSFLKKWMMFGMHRVNPSNKIVSPLLGDLADLPPTLIQASLEEMFLDDANRYVNKANAYGSVAELQVWPHTIHVWQAFDVPEARESILSAGKFLEQWAKK
jgi:acetyl esterase/lipase